MTIKPLVAGNWKMNGLGASLSELAEIARRHEAGPADAVDVMVCPPATLLAQAVETVETVDGGAVSIGAQDCHQNESGAHTGDISAAMIADTGAVAVIVGHSERRADHGETDAVVAAKAEAALSAGLVAILCCGETEAQRRAGETLDVVGGQLSGSIPAEADPARLVVAYEPVWAIGTGLTPTTDDVGAVHGFIRERLVERFGDAGRSIRILYGGSVKPANAADLMAVADVNGALVGGASLKAEDFSGIFAVYG